MMDTKKKKRESQQQSYSCKKPFDSLRLARAQQALHAVRFEGGGLNDDQRAFSQPIRQPHFEHFCQG